MQLVGGAPCGVRLQSSCVSAYPSMVKVSRYADIIVDIVS